MADTTPVKETRFKHGRPGNPARKKFGIRTRMTLVAERITVEASAAIRCPVPPRA